jgi:hypothetical protein
LRQQWQRQQFQRRAAGMAWKEHGLVFTHKHGGRSTRSSGRSTRSI